MKLILTATLLLLVGLTNAVEPIFQIFNQKSLYPLGPIYEMQTVPDDLSLFEGAIRVCAFQVYGIANNTFELQSFYNVQGLKFWEYIVNNKRDPPGLLLNGSYYWVNLTVINVGFDTPTTGGIANRTLINKEWGDFDIYIAPWATAKALDISPYSEKAKVPFITPWSATSTAFRCPDSDWLNTTFCYKPASRRWNYMWGLIPTSDTYWDSAVNLLKLKGTQTIAVWCLLDSFSLTLIGGAEYSAARNGLTVVTPSVLAAPYDWNVIRTGTDLLPSADQLTVVFKKMQEIGPEIIICGNRLPATCPLIVNIMKSLNYQPKAIGVSQCLSVDSILKDNDMRYFLDYSFWDPFVHGVSFTDKRDWDTSDFSKCGTYNSSSSSCFNNTYYDTVGNVPNFYAAGTYVAGYAFEQALEKAQTLNPDDLNNNFAYNLETTFWGNLGYNNFGWNDKGPILVVQRDSSNVLRIVYPSGTATNDIIFPFVDWSARTFQAFYLERTSEVVMFILFIICVVYSGVCLIFLIKYWKSRSVEASSPTFMTIMLMGSFLLYTTVPAWMIYVDISGVSCHLRFWFLSVGFTLLFGTLTAKTHRIKTLFFLKRMRPKKFSDTKLLRVVAVLVGIDIVLCILWSAITRPERIKIIRNGLGVDNGQIWENQNYLECDWNKFPGAMTTFLALVGTYKALMVFYGLFLSVSLWQYGSSMWVESKQIIFSMYNLILFALIGLALQLSLGRSTDRPTLEVLFVTRSVCILLCGAITIGAILIPRLLDPDGKGHEGKDTTGTKRTIDTTAIQLSDLEFKYDILQKKYKDLKTKYKDACPSDKLSEEQLEE